MSSTFDQYVGVSEEVTYATGVAVTRFYEYVSETLAGDYQRIEAQGVRAGTRAVRTDRFITNPKGAAGDLKLEVLDRTFGVFLKHMLGAIATAGAGPVNHTATVGDLRGKSLTVQTGVTANDGTLIPFTYEGCKIDKWELANSVDGVLGLNVTLDAAKETPGAGAGAYAVATPTFVTGAAPALLTFVGGVVQIAGADFAVSDASLKGDNKLKTDRYFIRTGGTTKKEPLEQDVRDFSFDLKGEFEGLTHYNRIASATAAGALATVTLKWASPVAGNQLLVTLQNARFDTGPVSQDGVKIVEHSLGGKALFDGTNSPVTAVYTTSDTTP